MACPRSRLEVAGGKAVEGPIGKPQSLGLQSPTSAATPDRQQGFSCKKFMLRAVRVLVRAEAITSRKLGATTGCYSHTAHSKFFVEVLVEVIGTSASRLWSLCDAYASLWWRYENGGGRRLAPQVDRCSCCGCCTRRYFICGTTYPGSLRQWPEV